MDLTFQNVCLFQQAEGISAILVYLLQLYEYVNLLLIQHIYYAYCQSLAEVEVCVSAKKKKRLLLH